MASNKEIVWADGRHRGYIRLAITHEHAHADFVAVSNVASRTYETNIIHQLDIKNVNGFLQFI